MSTLHPLAAIAALDSINPECNGSAALSVKYAKACCAFHRIYPGRLFCCLGCRFANRLRMTQVLAQIFNRLGEVIYVLQLIGGVILIILGYNSTIC